MNAKHKTPDGSKLPQAEKKSLLDDVVVTTAIVFLGVLIGITLFTTITLFIL